MGGRAAPSHLIKSPQSAASKEKRELHRITSFRNKPVLRNPQRFRLNLPKIYINMLSHTHRHRHTDTPIHTHTHTHAHTDTRRHTHTHTDTHTHTHEHTNTHTKRQRKKSRP